MIKDLRHVRPSGMRQKTQWERLAWPYVCGLLAENPSRYSSTLHNAGFKALDLPFAYHGFPVQDISIPIQSMREMGFRGYSVTIPYKEEVLDLIDGIGPEARIIGAVNTVINDGEQLHGYNTDWLGVAEAFRECKSKFDSDSCLVIGAGGGAKAAIHAMKKLGVKSIHVANRTKKRALELSQQFKVEVLETKALSENKLGEFSLIVNCTPGYEISFFPYEGLSPNHTVLDMVTADTRLIKAGNERGAKMISGIRMLLHQGIGQFRLFTEKEPPQPQMEEALLKLYQEKNGSV